MVSLIKRSVNVLYSIYTHINCGYSRAICKGVELSNAQKGRGKQSETFRNMTKTKFQQLSCWNGSLGVRLRQTYRPSNRAVPQIFRILFCGQFLQSLLQQIHLANGECYVYKNWPRIPSERK
jgi:hypothetical protein